MKWCIHYPSSLNIPKPSLSRLLHKMTGNQSVNIQLTDIVLDLSPINRNYNLQPQLILSLHAPGQSLTVKPPQELDLKCDLKCLVTLSYTSNMLADSCCTWNSACLYIFHYMMFVMPGRSSLHWLGIKPFLKSEYCNNNKPALVWRQRNSIKNNFRSHYSYCCTKSLVQQVLVFKAMIITKISQCQQTLWNEMHTK